MKKLNCLSIQEKENTRLIYREKTILGKAEYHNRVRSRLPVPKLVLLLSMGQARPMGATSHRPDARSLRPMGSVSPRTPLKPPGQI